MRLSLAGFAVLLLSSTSSAQLAAPGVSGVAMGHFHLNAKDPATQARFWTDVLGAQSAKVGPMDAYKLPGVLIMIRKADATAGSDGSTVNHIGFKVRDLKGTLAKAESAHIQVLTRSDQQAMLMAPDDLKVELTADPQMGEPAANHHIHFYAADVEATRKWYVDTFGAVPGKRGRFEAADLPGVNLTFAPAAMPPAGTKGRALDHIGFEVRDLESFCKKLEAGGAKFDVPYRKVPALGVGLAFFTDPWGTYIELTEGLDKI